MPRRRIRMEDLAQVCETSVSTVSRVLAGRPGVRADLRERVERAARERGYAMAPPVAGRTALLVASPAAMVDYARSQFTLHVLEGLRDRAATLGLTLETRAADRPLDELVPEVPDLAGLLLLSPDDETIAQAAALSIPVVLVNADDPEMRLSSVAPCNRTAARAATAALVAMGHRRIAFLAHPGRRTISQRRAGWAQALGEAGLAPDPDLEITAADWTPDAAAEAVSARLARDGLGATAILAAGDSLATGALVALRRAGVDVPGEVAVMGFDGLPQCELQTPPLSAVEIPMRAIGRVALDLLAEAQDGGSDLPPRRVELACRLVWRGSTGPAARG